MTPPPSEPTTGEKIVKAAAAERSISKLVSLIDAALAEVQRERDEAREWYASAVKVADEEKLARLATEQREREAGATIKEKVVAALREMREKPMHEDCYCSECWHTGARNQVVESCISQIHAALAAIHSAPAQPPQMSPEMLAKAERARKFFVSVPEDDSGATDPNPFDAPALVSDPPTAKGDERHRVWCNSRRVGGIGCTCPGVSVADPTEPKR